MNYTLTTTYIQSKQKSQVFGLKVTATFDAHSQTVLGFTYSHWPLIAKPETTESYLISPYTYDGLQDVAVAYLADYQKGLVGPYYLQMPLTAEQKKAAKETVEDTISSPNQKKQ